MATSDHPDGYTQRPRRNERQWPAGPLGHVASPTPVAIGFCPLCGSNARRTTAVRGLFDCPTCWHGWYDERVGKQTRTFDDYFSG